MAMTVRSGLQKRKQNNKEMLPRLPWCSTKAAVAGTSRGKILKNNLHVKGLSLNYSTKTEKHLHNNDSRLISSNPCLCPSPVSINLRKHSKINIFLTGILIFMILLSILHWYGLRSIHSIKGNKDPESKVLDKSCNQNNKERIEFALTTSDKTKRALRRLLKISKRLKQRNIKLSQPRPYVPTDVDYASSLHGGYTEAMSGVQTQEGRSIVIQGLWGSLKLWNEAVPPPGRINALPTLPPAAGDCWPMKGQQGGVVIHLWTKIYFQSVSILHIKPDVWRSAPKDFELYEILDNSTMKFASRGCYNSEGDHWQKFLVRPLLKTPIQRLAFRVLSNQGNSQYTCIYRILVHGIPAN